MATRQIYDFPDEKMSAAWGAQQAALEKGRDLVGAPEAAIAQAAYIPSRVPQPTAFDQLIGKGVIGRLAEVDEMSGWEQIRWRTSIEAPSLGSEKKREAAVGILDTMPNEQSRAIQAALRETIKNNREINWIRSQMGSVLPG